MMRTVRHPIAMFVIAVLVVIAIGVGVVAVTTNQKVYGPSWGRFTVAFQGRVYLVHEGTSLSTSTGPLTANIFIYSNKPYSWFGGAPLPGDFLAVRVETASSVLDNRSTVQQGVAAVMWGSIGTRVFEHEQDANGLTVITLGPQCAHGLCAGADVVFKGRVVWELLAFWNGPLNAVQGFLDSFQPIG
jgi:hypothetical protein